jgi:hypothetical protein
LLVASRSSTASATRARSTAADLDQAYSLPWRTYPWSPWPDMRTLHGTIRAAHDHTGTFSISPHTTPHEAPEGATSFATLFLKITLYALSGFKMVNSFVPSTSPGSSSSTWYLTSNVAIILTTNWFATFLPWRPPTDRDGRNAHQDTRRRCVRLLRRGRRRRHRLG